MIDNEWECLIEDLEFLKHRYDSWRSAREKGYDFFSDGNSIDKVRNYTERMFIEELELLRERMLAFPPRDNLLS